MKSLFYWNNWASPQKTTTLTFIILLSVCLSFFFFSFSFDEESIIPWETIQKSENVKSSIGSFERNMQDFEISANNYLVFQYFRPGYIQIDTPYALIYTAIMFLAISGAMAALTTAKSKILLLVGTVMSFGWLYTLELHQLNVFPDQYFLSLACIAIAIVTYVLHFLLPSANFWIRWGAYVVVFGGVMALALAKSDVAHPMLHIANHGLKGSLVLCALFIFGVSQELPGLFVGLVSYAKGTKGIVNILNFSVVTVIYLVNLLLLYLSRDQSFDLELLYFNPYIVLVLSTILGIWGIARRVPKYENLIRLENGALIIYLSIALFTFATLSYLFATHETALIDSVIDWIIYTHLAMGTLFWVFIMRDYFRDLDSGLPVYKYIYIRNKTPFFSVRALALLFIIFLMAPSTWKAYRHVQGGLNSTIGHIHLAADNTKLAQEKYDLARIYYPGDFKTSYAAACISFDNQEYYQCAKALKSTLRNDPRPLTYALMSHATALNSKYLYTVFNISIDLNEIRDGHEQFPWEPRLLNNLGVSYLQNLKPDSAALYLNMSGLNLEEEEGVPSANIIGLLLKNELYSTADSLLQVQKVKDDLIFRSNVLLLNTKMGRRDTSGFIITIDDSTLTSIEVAYINNYVMHHLGESSPKVLEALAAYIASGEDVPYLDRIEYLAGLIQFNQSNFEEALELFKRTLIHCDGTLLDHYKDIISQHFYKIDNVAMGDLIQEYNRKGKITEALTIKGGYLNYLMSKSENGDLEEDPTLMLNLQNLALLPSRSYARELLGSVTAYEPLINAGDSGIAIACHYHPQAIKDQNLYEKLQGIKNPELKSEAVMALIDRFFARQQLNNVALALELLNDLEVSPRIYAEIAYRNTLLELSQGSASDVLSYIDEVQFSEGKELKKPLFKAICHETLGDSTEAEKWYNIAMKQHALDELTQIRWAYFVLHTKKDNTGAFNIIRDAVERSPNSVELNKAYVIMSLNEGHLEFAESGFEDLETLMDPEDYSAYGEYYEQERELALKSLENW